MKNKKLPTDVAYNVITIRESRKVAKRKTPGPETRDLNDAFRDSPARAKRKRIVTNA